jgi:hypothetical protein
MTIITPLIILLLISGETQSDTGAEASDSLVYSRQKIKLLSADSTRFSHYIAAADELAALGLYSQALTLLNTLSENDTTATAATPQHTASGSAKTHPDYRVRIGGEYIDFNDPESRRNEAEIIDPHSLDDRRAFVSAGLSWKPLQEIDCTIEPEIELSNQDASGALAGALWLLDSIVRCDIETGGEKRFWHERYDTVITPRGDKSLRISETQFAGNRAEDADLLFGGARVNITNRYRPRRLLASCPVGVDFKKYRADSPPYISFIEYALSPELEYNSPDYSRSILFHCDSRYRTYASIRLSQEVKDTADRALLVPELTVTLWKKKYSLETRYSYMYEHYFDAEFPRNWGCATSYARAKLKSMNILEPSVSAEYRYEHSRRIKHIEWNEITDIDTSIQSHPIYGTRKLYDTTFTTHAPAFDYSVGGHSLCVESRIIIQPSKLLSFLLGIRVEDTWYDDYENRFHITHTGSDTTLWRDYLSESLRSVQPEIGIGLEHTRFNLNCRGGYMYTQSKNPGKYDYDTRKSWRITVDGNVVITHWLSAYSLTSCELSYYDRQGEAQINLSLSGGFSFNL